MDKNGNIFISINHFKELLKDWLEYGMPRKDELKITSAAQETGQMVVTEISKKGKVKSLVVGHDQEIGNDKSKQLIKHSG